MNSRVSWGSDAADTDRANTGQNTREVAEIHQRLDSISRQIETMSGPGREPGVARQLNDAISRLDARLGAITEPPRAAAPPLSFAPSMPQMASPPTAPSLEDAIAEIAARQHQLDAGMLSGVPLRGSAAARADLSGIERQLTTLNGKIDDMRRPQANVEQSVAAFRAELADIRGVILDAMPRRAIDSIENEIRALSRRIDDTRHSGADSAAMANVERALDDIRGVLRSLTPAEQLAGFDDAIRNLGGKIDMIVRSSDDPGTIGQLSDAIAALRAIVANVASNDSLTRLGDDVRMVAAKLDQVSRPDTFGESFAALEQRIAGIAATLEKRPAGSSDHLEGALRALSDRLDHIPAGSDAAATIGHLEQRVSFLLERLEGAADQRGGSHIVRVEEGLQDVLRQLERQSSMVSSIADPRPAAGMDAGLVDTIKRELAEMRFNQTETDRHTQDSLEVVHNTLGHVVDRLAMIEGDLRGRSVPAPAAPMVSAATAPHPAERRPDLPNPAVTQVQARRAAPATPAPEPETAMPRAETAFAAAPRHAINPELPPDHPLEPGSLHAAIERAPEADPDARDNGSNFIAAARRAAQAAQAAMPVDARRPTALSSVANSTIGSKIKSLLVGASVVIIVLGSFKMAMNMLDGQPVAEARPPAAPPPLQLAPPEPDTRPDNRSGSLQPQLQTPAAAAPSVTSPTPIGRQSLVAPPVPALDQMPAQFASAGALPDVTGSISARAPAAGGLPDAIGSAGLRAAALKGDPAAAFEIGQRYADGRGVPASYEDAARWYERAAQGGLIPAVFRLGTLYEKGLGVKKDYDIARRNYTAAAERGNAKAMHNLAVLNADGGGSGANYKAAGGWFRKAAERGVADSQYNLGILYARGIGVEQNLAESYKWFSLAAAQGDADSAVKRDDIAKKLDAQSLAAAKLAVQTFTPEPQPADATTVPAPEGGWDAATQAGGPPIRAAKKALR